MESSADIGLAAALVAIAGGFLVRRFTGPRKPPSCAPEGNARPQVILGSRLARGLEATRRERERR